MDDALNHLHISIRFCNYRILKLRAVPQVKAELDGQTEYIYVEDIFEEEMKS